jgi:hypothetical protein
MLRNHKSMHNDNKINARENVVKWILDTHNNLNSKHT